MLTLVITDELAVGVCNALGLVRGGIEMHHHGIGGEENRAV